MRRRACRSGQRTGRLQVAPGGKVTAAPGTALNISLVILD
jgi:hypothetical protein